MKLTIGGADAASAKVDVLALGVFEGEKTVSADLPKPLARAANQRLSSSGFSGKEGKVASAPGPARSGATTLLFVGLGRRRADALEPARRAAGTVLSRAGEYLARRVAFVPPAPDPATAEASAEGFLLADYEFDRYKKASGGGDARRKEREVQVTLRLGPEARASVKRALPRLEATAAGVKLARDLGNEPANVLTPARLAAAAEELAKSRRGDGIRCRVLLPAEIRDKGMGAFLGVAQGSVEEPRFIHLSWQPSGARRKGDTAPRRRVALIGKGLCFDSGGISIKPAQSMEDMKFDMCGAAAVLGVFRCLPELGITHEVHGFVAATENMPSGSATRPGDILRSMAGRTIEVINTDAEGRLTLVDAISYAVELKPDVIVDLATLTGACAVALGPASGIMSNDDALRDALWASSDAVGERAWPLPLFDDYRSQLKSDFADVKNLGDRYGGALTAGLFLKEWVPEGLPWAHLDIAGSAWTDRELAYCPKGATGIGVRTLAHWLRSFEDSVAR